MKIIEIILNSRKMEKKLKWRIERSDQWNDVCCSVDLNQWFSIEKWNLNRDKIFESLIFLRFVLTDLMIFLSRWKNGDEENQREKQSKLKSVELKEKCSIDRWFEEKRNDEQREESNSKQSQRRTQVKKKRFPFFFAPRRKTKNIKF